MPYKEEKRFRFSPKLAAAVMIIVVIAAAALFLNNSPSSAAEKVRGVYSLLSESNAEVISVKEESGVLRILLRVPLRNGQPALQDVLATKDGSIMTDRIINTSAFASQLQREKAFAECLAAKNVVIAGVSTDANTVAQLQAIGNYAYKVYVDCAGANLQVCQSAGITAVPTIVVGNQSVAGPQPLSFFVQATGCAL